MNTRLIIPKVVLCKGADQYDLAMHFLRYQEYYESASPSFKGKPFFLVDYMDWYRKERKAETFTYPEDWGGFNIPASVVHEIWDHIPDRNPYDGRMLNIAQLAGPDGYIIGAQDAGTIRHELAHGLFYTNEAYRTAAQNLVARLSPLTDKDMRAELKRMGYARQVHTDEIQAYMATGLTDEMKIPPEVRKPFRTLFRAYTKGVR